MQTQENPIPDDPLKIEKVTVEQAAKLLHCATAKVYRLARRGTIRGWKVGRATLLALDDVRACLRPIEPRAERREKRHTSAAQRRADEWTAKVGAEIGE